MKFININEVVTCLKQTFYYLNAIVINVCLILLLRDYRELYIDSNNIMRTRSLPLIPRAVTHKYFCSISLTTVIQMTLLTYQI